MPSLVVSKKECKNRTEDLVTALSDTGATCAVVVHGDLDHVQASNIGHNSHDSEAATNVRHGQVVKEQNA